MSRSTPKPGTLPWLTFFMTSHSKPFVNHSNHLDEADSVSAFTATSVYIPRLFGPLCQGCARSRTSKTALLPNWRATSYRNRRRALCRTDCGGIIPTRSKLDRWINSGVKNLFARTQFGSGIGSVKTSGILPGPINLSTSPKRRFRRRSGPGHAEATAVPP